MWMPLARHRAHRTEIASCANLNSSVGPQIGHLESFTPS
jgi:hypothetical protein